MTAPRNHALGRNSGLIRLIAAVLSLALVATACGSGDDGAVVRDLGAEAGDDAGLSSTSSSNSGVAVADTVRDAAGDGGYEYASNVDGHRLVVADICEIATALDEGDFETSKTIYAEGKNSVNSDGSIRSIGGFASREDRLHGLAEYYGSATPLDDFVTSALDGTGDFDGEADAVRSQGVEKGIQNQTMIAWAIHELNTAIAKAEDGDFDVASGAVHNWDEGWAFFHGSQPGCAPYATGDKRAANFGTVGSDGITALANQGILAAMTFGRDALLAEDVAGAKAAADDVVKNIAITYSQATVRYAHLITGDLADGDDAAAREHQAEGYAFWRVVESILVPAGADGEAINAILGLDNAPGENGAQAEVRAALQPAWDALGISAVDIGNLS